MSKRIFPERMLLYRLQRSLWLLGVCIAMVTYAHEGHHSNDGSQQKAKSFNDPSFTQDEEHIKEHLKDQINMKDKKMTPEEMEFHYFRLHDANNDTHLDGIEILQAMSHMMPAPELQLHEKLGKSKEQIEAIMAERQKEMMKYYEDLIDRVLMDDDVDKNGYLSYTEFIRARRREEYHVRRMQEENMKMHQNQQWEQFQQFQQYQAMQAQQHMNVQQMQIAQGQGQGQGQGQFRPTIPPPPPVNGGSQQNQQHPPQVNSQRR